MYDEDRIGIFLVLGRKGFNVTEFQDTDFDDPDLKNLVNKDNTKFKSFPNSDPCDMKPQNSKTAYFFEK